MIAPTRLLPGLAIALAITLAVTACSPPPPTPETVIRPVRYIQVTPLSAMERRVFSGVAQAAVETDMSFKVAGLIAQRPVNIGDEVAQGDVLARLDPKDYQVRVQEAEAGLARAQAEMRNARSMYERTRNLYENRNASRSDLDAARAASESGEAAVRASAQQLEAARLQLSYTTLRAPQACSIAATFAKTNENVNAGQPVVQLNCGDCSEILVSVAETVIDRIEPGIEVGVDVSALPDRTLEGVVTEVGVAAVGTTYPVTVRLVGDCPGIRSGMAADVTIALPRGEVDGRIAVPPVAVGEDSQGRYVYVLEATSDDLWIARRRAITVGTIAGEGIVVESGLAAGELIATAGVKRIRDGQTLTLQTGTAY